MKKQEKLQNELVDLEKQEQLVQKKIALKRRQIARDRFGKNDRLTFVAQYLVDGVIAGRTVVYDRGVETYPHSFEWFLEYCMIIEGLRKASNTSIDLLIDKYAKKFSIDAEEKTRLMQKYWHKKGETIADIVKLWSAGEREFYETEELFISSLTLSAIRKFEYAPLEIKYGILYFIFKYHENGDFDELKKDVETVPEKIRLFVDSFFSLKH